MAEKRNSKKKYKRRRRRGAGIFLRLLCLLLIIAAIFAAIMVFFKIKNIKVTGESRYSSEDIIELSGLKKSGNMFMFNKFAAINRIFAKCPYLDEISIRRRLPDEIEIIVTECQPVAVVEDDKTLYIMDKNGKLLEKCTEEQAASYCRIKTSGLDGAEVGKYASFKEQDEQKPLFLLLNRAQNSDILQHIGVIDVTEVYNISFTYGDRFTVKIGTSENIDKKLKYMQVIIDEKLGQAETGTIDVSDIQTARFIPN